MNEVLSTRQLADCLGITKQSLLERAKKECWPCEIINKRGDRRYHIKDLPPDIQKALAEKDAVPVSLVPQLAPEAQLTAYKKLSIYNEIANTVPDLAAWAPERVIDMEVLRDPQVQKRARMVQEAQQVPKGWKKRAWIEAVAAKHGTTFQTVYRYLKRYEERGLAGLKHKKNNKGKPKTWSPEAIDFWVGLCLKREHRKIDKLHLYKILCHEALKHGWSVGTYQSAMWWLDKKVSPQLLALQRGGVRALDNSLPPVLRDYSDLEPFELLVGDQHRFDFWVVDEETGEVFRPEGYFWQDLCTRLIYGGALDRKYDSYLMGLALRMGLMVFGAFGSIYTDWGKPEQSRYIMGILRDMRTIGLDAGREVDIPSEAEGLDPEEVNPIAIIPGTHKKAIVRNAKAKMIEGTFDKLQHILRSVFLVPGYVKDLSGPSEENEVDEKELRRLAEAGKLLTFWEFARIVMKAMDYYNNERPHRGVLREWKGRPKPKQATPMDALRARYTAGWRPGPVSREAIDLIFLPRARRTVDRGRITFQNEQYEHEALVELNGTRVECRYDPLDPGWIMVFQEGKYLCTAKPVEYSSMKNRALASRKIAEKARIRKGFLNEYRRYTSGIPDYRQFSEVPASERAPALIGKDKQRRLEEQKKISGPSDEEILAGVEEIENYRPTRPRPIFASKWDRYRWILEQEAEGCALDEEDITFKTSFEAEMDDDTREYWQVYKESLAMQKAGKLGG